MNQVTLLIQAIERGESGAADQLLPIVYDELRRLAAQKIRQEKPGQTLQGTALVHEAYIRLVGDDNPSWQNRGHFFAAAAEAMRRILVERARQKQSLRGGGGVRPLDITQADVAVEIDPIELISLDEALSELGRLDETAAQVVKLRFFGGLSETEAADALGVSRSTVQRSWVYARAWLHRKISCRDDKKPTG
jgi:RNA polymerase sigma factor (TIGR02999 family)